MNKINENGSWEGKEAASYHIYDKKLSSALVDFFINEKVKTLVDLGCGMGDYVKHFIESKIDACGYDGNPNTPELTNNTCKVLDLSEPIKFDTPFSWVMSLEVGEHLPKKFEDIFINNLHHNNENGVLLSWAVKGQGGHGHYNELDNDYIKSKICKLGYINDIEAEEKLRKQSSLLWFKNSIMVFRKFHNSFPSIDFNKKNTFDHGWFNNGNKLIFDKIIDEYSIKNMCELGSWFGTSARYFSSKVNGKIYCIDLWYNAYINHKEDNEFIDDLYNYEDKILLKDRSLYSTFLNNLYEFRDTIVPIKTDTISGIELLYNQKIQIDLFYIDANHTYDSVKKEIMLIKEKYPSALIFGDDYSSTYPGVKKAVDELKDDNTRLVVIAPCWFYKPMEYNHEQLHKN